MQADEQIILKRDCDAVLIPAGQKIILQAGEPVTITQALGGSFTVYIRGNLARIDERDADALGKISAKDFHATEPAAKPGLVDKEMIWEKLRTCYDPEIPVNIVDLGLIYD